MTDLIVRRGPRPEETEDSTGQLHASFTGFFILVFNADENDFDQVVASLWAQIVADGDGHMLVGQYSGFEYTAQRSAQSCARSWGTAKNGYEFAPKNYKPLFAVARSVRSEKDGDTFVDIAVDYRNATDISKLKPAIYGSGEYIREPRKK